MDESLLSISYIGTILLIGLLCSIISKKLKISNLLLLILVGMGLGAIKLDGEQLLQFPAIFLTSIAIVTLAMIVFDSSSKFKFREFDTISASALKLSIIFLILNMAALAGLAYYLFKPSSMFPVLIFAVVVSGTDPSSAFAMLSGARSKLFELLKVEAILNTPLTILIPFIIIDIMNVTGGAVITVLSSKAVPFVQQFVAGIGTGVLFALIFFRFMKRYYSNSLSPLALITAAILTYISAEALGGNGVLAVTTAGIVFGNVYKIKHMRKLIEFGEEFSLVLEILVFILIGSIIKLPFTAAFLIPATLLFLAYLAIRLISIEISFFGENYTLKEKLYMTLNIPKGISVAVVVFTLATREIEGIGLSLDLILLFMIYSIILSTVVMHFTKYFTKVNIKPRKEE